MPGRPTAAEVAGWALLRTNGPEPEAYARWRPIWRIASDPADGAYSAGGGPPATTVPERARVAGTWWAIAECFGRKGGGPDEYEVRSRTG